MIRNTVIAIVLLFATIQAVTSAKAQTNNEQYTTPWGTLTVYEIKRDNEPNLVCFGIDVLAGCELRK